MHEHDIVRNAELRKFRREQLLQRQNLEKVLLTEVRVIKGAALRYNNNNIYLHCTMSFAPVKPKIFQVRRLQSVF